VGRQLKPEIKAVLNWHSTVYLVEDGFGAASAPQEQQANGHL